MKIYIMESPKLNDVYASFSHIGTWSNGNLCEKCGQPTSRLVEPLKIKWEYGSDKIGDFSWCGYTTVITDRVLKILKTEHFGIKPGSVDVVDPTLKSKKAKMARVPFPYTGPKLHWLLLNDRVSLNEQKSNVSLDIACNKCGQNKYTFRRTGIVVDEVNWKKSPLFYVKQFDRSRVIFVTEEAKDILKGNNISNIGFHEAGIIR